MITLYHENGDVAHVAPHNVEHFLTKKQGWSREAPAEPPKEPSLDLSSLNNSQLLHIVAVLRLESPPDAMRETIEGMLYDAWVAANKPEGWRDAMLAEVAPIPAEEMPIPNSHSEEETIETPDEFAERAKTVVPTDTAEEPT